MSDRHMEKAREIAGAVAGQVCDNTDAAAVETLATKLIATALAEAEREGMRRAAEIAKMFDTKSARAVASALLRSLQGTET